MKLFRFKGGVKLSGYKALSNKSGIIDVPLPERLIIPLRQHIGAPAEAIVELGEKVAKGQVIATPTTYISAPVHASTSGIVVAIEERVIPHQSGISELCIVLAPDGKDRWHKKIKPISDPDSLSAEVLISKIRQAGIVGLGGAVFPSAAKLKPTRTIDTLIINGAECEPYITCDDVLMRFRANAIVRGILLLRRIVEPIECIIAVEDNKPEAIKILKVEIDKLKKTGLGSVNTIQVVAVPTLFPAGGEKQLIKVVTGKEVPQHGLPYEVGVVCMNVGTTAAIYEAIYDGKPLVTRLVTVTGSQVTLPANYEVLIGTPVEHLLHVAGGTLSQSYNLIMGGPMMGQVLPDQRVPIVKASNCILVENTDEDSRSQAMPCIRCGSCASVCPMQLLPQQLYWYARGKDYTKLEHYNLADCIECGCCSIVCPSKIPLVQYFRFAKTEKKEYEIKAKFAEQSRVRTQAREDRLIRIKQEQEERKAKRKAARKKKAAAKVTDTLSDATTDKNKTITVPVISDVNQTARQRDA